MSENIALDTPEQIAAYRYLAVRSALALEVKTGMKYSNRMNVFKVAKQILTEHGVAPKGTKRAVWVQFNDLCLWLGLPETKASPL